MFLKGASSKYKAKAIIIIIVGFLTMYCSGMFGTDIINVIQNPIMEELGCSATAAVMGWSIAGYTLLFATFFFSSFIMKWGAHKFATISFAIMAIGAILVGVGFGSKSVVIISIGGLLLRNFAVALQTCMFQLVAGWFNKTRGFVLGILGAAFALDNSTSSTGLTMLYKNLGFGGMIAVATSVMVVIGLVTLIFLRNTPEECGLTIDGVESDEVAGKAENSEGDHFASNWTLKRFLMTKESWFLGITIGVFNLTLTGVVTQFFNSMTAMGVEQSACMGYMVVFGLLGIVMSPIYGKIVDKFGAPKTGVIAAVLYALSVAGFCFNIPILGALGLTFFVGAPILQPALTIHIYGAKEYQAVNRFSSVVISIIGAFAVPFMTVIYDLTGAYSLAYQILLVLNIIALICMLLCKKSYANE